MLQLKFSAWFGNLGLKNKNKRINVAGEGDWQATDIFEYHIWHCNTLPQLSIDSSHPLNSELALLRSVCPFTARLLSLTTYTRSPCPLTFLIGFLLTSTHAVPFLFAW